MSAIYFMGQKYTGPTLNLGSGSLTTDNKTIVGAINEINERYKTVVIEVPTFSSLPKTVLDSRIRADHTLTEAFVGTPSAVGSVWDVAFADGSLTISGTITGSTTLTLSLNVKKS